MSRSILRTGISCLKRIQAGPSFSGAFTAERNWLMYQRQPGIFSLNQSASFNVYSEERRRIRIKKLFLREYEKGVFKIPEPRVVNSLPPKKVLDGAEDFIAYEVVVIPQVSSGPLNYPYILCAVSKKGQFKRICKPLVRLFDRNQRDSGLIYDTKNKVVLESGIPVETVEPKLALKEFIDFIKEHNDPVLLTFGSRSLRSLFACTKEFGVHDDLTAAVPYQIDTKLALKKAPVKRTGIKGACKEIFNVDIATTNPMEIAQGNLSLFTNYLLRHRPVKFFKDLNTVFNMQTYVELIYHNLLPLPLAEKLSKAGIRLDHLNYLKNEGIDQFTVKLKERGIQSGECRKLYNLVVD